MTMRNMAERRILAAQAEGTLDDLAGAGKPLPANPGTDDVTGAGFRIMAEAGALPREIELKKAVAAQRDAVQAACSDAERKERMAALADLELRLAIEQEARRKFQRS